jgi:1-acyl-sn-glycerol-3-phosphate acyltransferase
VLRAVLLLLHVLAGVLLALPIRGADIAGVGRRVPRERIAGAWHRTLLRILGVRVSVQGAPLRTPHLLVSNHVSWLDIPLIGASTGIRFVSRHDVQRWPVAGLLAQACGTFYIERGAGRSQLTAAAMRAHLETGSVALFPEGTTTDGTGVAPFRARLFQAALDAGVPVQPVALRYTPARDGTPIAPFVDDDALLPHLLRILRAGELQVELQFLPALFPEERAERRALALVSQRHVERALQARCRRPGPGERYQ